jgi:hypothetical protein
MKTCLIIFFALLAYSSSVKARTFCLCQTGTEPDIEKPAYAAGCQIWLNNQVGCHQKVMEEYNTLMNFPQSWRNGVLRLGYVGHWRNSRETVDFLSRAIIPAVWGRNLSVDWHNTACGVMDDPTFVQTYLRNAANIDTRTYVSVTGAQTISIGIWAGLLPPTANVPATVRSDRVNPSYAACEDYRNKACVREFQNTRRVVCRERTGVYRRLICTQSSGIHWAWAQQDSLD